MNYPYYPFIDGLRAISIFLVVAFHNPGPLSARIGEWFHGWAGVEIFFVISGFLITSILMSEAQAKGDISLPKFYARRCLRIWPAYYFFLLVFALLWSGQKDFEWQAIGICALYLSNFDLAFEWGYLTRAQLLRVTWSLAQEEQYYLFWPWVMKFLRDKLFVLLIASISIVLIWRAVLVYWGASEQRLVAGFDTQIDSILWGCLAATAWAHQTIKARIINALKWPFAPPASLALLTASLLWLTPYANDNLVEKEIFWCLKFPLLNMSAALVILTLHAHQENVISKTLSVKPLVWLGRLSYSLYLWHSFVIAVCRTLLPVKENPMVAELGAWALCLLTANCSYQLIEFPILKLKKRFAR